MLTLASVRSVDEVLGAMQAIDQGLPDADGVKWFNRLYLRVTERVREHVQQASFRDPAFIARLDVVFANLYFSAFREAQIDPGRAPAAWRPLFRARATTGVARLQFALAGMNAHINRDLPLALVETCRAQRVSPRRGGPQYADFRAIDRLLAETEARVRVEFATGLVGVADEALGELDSVVAMWNVRRARGAAWVNAETLWALRELPFAAGRFVVTLDRMVGFAGRGLLRPVL